MTWQPNEREQRNHLPFVVGVNTGAPVGLRRFATEDEAAEFVGTLLNAEEGIYYIDGPQADEERTDFNVQCFLTVTASGKRDAVVKAELAIDVMETALRDAGLIDHIMFSTESTAADLGVEEN